MPQVHIDKLRIDGGIQSRADIDGDTVKEYAEAIKAGANRKEGPITAYDDGESLWVASGFTWLAAERLSGAKKIAVEIVKGSKRDALLHSVGCNSDHGKRRTPADKRHAISLVLADEEWRMASDRWIAERCRVDNETVTRVRAELYPKRDKDSEDASDDGNATSSNDGEKEEEKRTGADGKKYPARKRGRILCDRCKRLAPAVVKDCPACKDLNRKGAGKKKPDAGSNGQASNGEEDAPKDAFGNVIPKKRRDAFCDPWIQNTIDYLAPLVAAFWQEKHANGMHKRAKHFPFFVPKDFVDGCAMVGNTLEQLIDHLKENRPAGVCPMCEGKGCGDCRMSGLVPRKLYAELKKKAKKEAVK